MLKDCCLSLRSVSGFSLGCLCIWLHSSFHQFSLSAWYYGAPSQHSVANNMLHSRCSIFNQKDLLLFYYYGQISHTVLQVLHISMLPISLFTNSGTLNVPNFSITKMGVTTYESHFDCFSSSDVVALVGMLLQSSGKVQKGNDILQEKFQSCSDNRFYRIKSWPTSAQHISILRGCRRKILRGQMLAADRLRRGKEKIGR